MSTTDISPLLTQSPDVYGGERRAAWMDVDWRAHQRWLMIHDTPVDVVEISPPDSTADAIVFVHGHAGSWTNWLCQLPELSQTHRVIAPDLPGFGRSPMPNHAISMTEYARDIDELMDQLGVSSACVVGNSMGGFIAAELAIRFPQRVSSLVLVSAAGVSTRYMYTPARLMAMGGYERFLAAIGPWTRVSKRRASRLVRRPRLRGAALGIVAAHPQKLPPETAWELMRGAGMPAIAPAGRAIANYDFRDRLPEIACPTLVVWGARDLVVPPSAAGEFERLIPDAQKVIFDDTGHVPMIERPARFNALLRKFLAGTTPGV
jgi:pimeloyl-ACP methyl ester carboxylesterase